MDFLSVKEAKVKKRPRQSLATAETGFKSGGCSIDDVIGPYTIPNSGTHVQGGQATPPTIGKRKGTALETIYF